MVKRILLVALCYVFWAEPSALCQTSVVLPWQLPAPQQDSRVYRPEPILFVHGVNDNDAGWQSVLDALNSSFSGYQSPNTLPTDTSRQRATQYAFLNTFNYGDAPSISLHNKQAFDHIEWNAWSIDRDSKYFTNIFNGASQPHPTDNRETLDERINGNTDGSIVGIRSAYAITINSVTTPPQIVLVAHRHQSSARQ